MVVCHRLEARGARRGRRGDREDARGESARDAEAGVLPELLGYAGLVLREEHDEDAEGVGDATLSESFSCLT